MKELTRRNVLTSALSALFAIPAVMLAGGRNPPTGVVATAVASGEPDPFRQGTPVQGVDFYSEVSTIQGDVPSDIIAFRPIKHGVTENPYHCTNFHWNGSEWVRERIVFKRGTDATIRLPFDADTRTIQAAIEQLGT